LGVYRGPLSDAKKEKKKTGFRHKNPTLQGGEIKRNKKTFESWQRWGGGGKFGEEKKRKNFIGKTKGRGKGSAGGEKLREVIVPKQGTNPTNLCPTGETRYSCLGTGRKAENNNKNVVIDESLNIDSTKQNNNQS